MPDIEILRRELDVMNVACSRSDAEVMRLRAALQRIADLPPPEHLTRPYKRTPQKIAIAALKRRALAVTNGTCGAPEEKRT
jgi:hypothetical protein